MRRAALVGSCLLCLITGVLKTNADAAVYEREATPRATPRTKIRVASKQSTESSILSEMVAQIIEQHAEATVVRKLGLDGSSLVLDAMQRGEIDVDVSDIGTLAKLTVKDNPHADLIELRAALQPLGLTLSAPLGFNLRDARELHSRSPGVIVMRTEVVARCPHTWAALRRLEGKFSDEKMAQLSARVDDKKQSIEEVARAFLRANDLLVSTAMTQSLLQRCDRLWSAIVERLGLVVALFLSCLFGFPLGVLAYRQRLTNRARP